MALAAGASVLLGSSGIDVNNLTGISESLGGVGTIEGMEGLTDSIADLDSILSEEGPPGLLNAMVGGLAGLANGLNEMVGADAEVDDDLAGSALEDLAAGGVDGFELEAFFEVVKSVLVGILELIGLGL